MPHTYMTKEDETFFNSQGWRQISMAEFRCNADHNKTVELMTYNHGYWTGRNLWWEGPKAETPTAAFIAAELAGWGEGEIGTESIFDSVRRRFKDTFSG